MSNKVQQRIALEAAQLLLDGSESEYLQAKERAALMLGISNHTRLPSNAKIKQLVAELARAELGAEEVCQRLRQMREIAWHVMSCLRDYETFLIGSTLSGKISRKSDIDLHAYADDPEVLAELLERAGYGYPSVETVENRKGEFVHLRWNQDGYPVEITVYPLSWRDVVPISSITGKPMKRADAKAVRKLLEKASTAADTTDIS
jgi:hypothetical protein